MTKRREENYLHREYGVSTEEWRRFRHRMAARRRRGKYILLDGKLNPKRLDSIAFASTLRG